MGKDYTCGCRESFGHWFPCKNHLEALELLIAEQLKIEVVEKRPIGLCHTMRYYAKLLPIPKHELENYEEGD